MSRLWGGPAARCQLIGMVHLDPLPGSPGWHPHDHRLDWLVERAVGDTRALLDHGCDAVIVENMADLPYARGSVLPETVAAFTLAAHAVVRAAGPAPVGLQLLAGANRQALGVALTVGARFLRVEGFAYGHLADEGWFSACAPELLRARRALFPPAPGAHRAGPRIWADVQKKHASHAVTADLDLGQLAHGFAFCGADALILTGSATGQPTDPAQLEQARGAGLPLLVGSGVTPQDAAPLAARADGLIVGSWLKRDGNWRRRVDPDRVRTLRGAMEGR